MMLHELTCFYNRKKFSCYMTEKDPFLLIMPLNLTFFMISPFLIATDQPRRRVSTVHKITNSLNSLRIVHTTLQFHFFNVNSRIVLM